MGFLEEKELEKKKKLKKRIILLIIVVVAIIVVASVFKMKNRSDDVQMNQVQLQMIEKKDLSDSISLSGTVSGETKINYTSDATSTFLTVNVEVGDEVKKGDVLATLDKESIQKQIAALEKSISNSKALAQNQSDMNKAALEDAKEEQKEQLADAKKVVDKAKKEMEAAKADYEVLLNDPDADPADMEMAKEAANLAVEAYDEAQDGYDAIKKSTDAAIESAQNVIDMEKYSDSGDDVYTEQLDELKKQLDECEIICEEDGVVISVNAYKGGQNTPGSPIFTVENNKSMVMTASVEETDILKLEEGMKAIVTAKALGDQEIQGEVIKVLKVANSSSGSYDMEGMSSGAAMSGFSVQIKLEESQLISGMSAKAKILLTDKQDVLCVPYDLVQTDENGDTFVLCAEENGDGQYTAVKKMVTVGEEVDYYTEITGGDIKEGDYVILDTMIYEGMVFDASTSMSDLAVEEMDY